MGPGRLRILHFSLPLQATAAQEESGTFYVYAARQRQEALGESFPLL